MSFFKKSPWRKIIIEVVPMEWREFDLFSWTLADAVADSLNCQLYFAKYSSSVTSQCRVEIQLDVKNITDANLQLFVIDLIKKSSPGAARTVDVTGSDGSEPHAAAYLLSRKLRAQGEPLTKDVIHWLLNMTGYSYAQEIRLLCEEAAQMAGNIDKMS